MLSYLYLAIAIISELFGTSMLKASEGFTKLWPSVGVIVSFLSSFFFLSMSLKYIPLSVAYAIWSGLGTVATTVISILIWKEKASFGSVVGIALIVAGVVVLNLFSPGHGQSSSQPIHTDTTN